MIYTPGCIDATLQLIEQELPLVAGLVIGFAVPVVSLIDNRQYFICTNTFTINCYGIN